MRKYAQFAFLFLVTIAGMFWINPVDAATDRQCACEFSIRSRGAAQCDNEGSFDFEGALTWFTTIAQHGALTAKLTPILQSACEDNSEQIRVNPQQAIQDSGLLGKLPIEGSPRADAITCESIDVSGTIASRSFALQCNGIVSAPEGCYCRVQTKDGPMQRVQELSASTAQEATCPSNSGKQLRDSTPVFECSWREDAPKDDGLDVGKADTTGNVRSSDISALNRFSVNANGTASVRVLIGKLLKFITSIIGVIALLVIIYGGVLWMFAMGNSQREEQAKDIIFWAILGVLAILGSYAILDFIIKHALPVVQAPR